LQEKNWSFVFHSTWLQRAETRVLMDENRVKWEIPRDAVPEDVREMRRADRPPSRPPCRAQHRGDSPLVYRTSVFHYVMGHCTAQSYRSGMEQCRWVSYNTSGVGQADKRARERAPRSSLRFVIKENDRKRNY